MEKKYDYDKIMEFCQNNLSAKVEALCLDLKEMRELVEELEENYHGKGERSSIRSNYFALYNNIGQLKTDDSQNCYSSGNGLWSAAASCRNYTNLMYTAAKKDSEADQNSEFFSSYYN